MNATGFRHLKQAPHDTWTHDDFNFNSNFNFNFLGYTTTSCVTGSPNPMCSPNTKVEQSIQSSKSHSFQVLQVSKQSQFLLSQPSHFFFSVFHKAFSPLSLQTVSLFFSSFRKVLHSLALQNQRQAHLVVFPPLSVTKDPTRPTAFGIRRRR